MSGPDWRPLGPPTDFPSGSLRGLRVEDHRLCIGHSERGLFAVSDTCPHAGGSLSEGMVKGREVICPLHAWGFDVTTGASPEDPSCTLTVYELRTRGDAVEVRIAPDPRRRPPA